MGEFPLLASTSGGSRGLVTSHTLSRDFIFKKEKKYYKKRSFLIQFNLARTVHINKTLM